MVARLRGDHRRRAADHAAPEAPRRWRRRFWLALAAGLGVLAASGHCMTTHWSFAPVCGVDFWRVIVTSPEVLIFLFFMITDPKTVADRAGRPGACSACWSRSSSTLLMAPQTDEFGTKVGLLAGLVARLRGAARCIDRFVPEPRSPRTTCAAFAAASSPAARPRRCRASALRAGWRPSSCSSLGAGHRRRRGTGARVRRRRTRPRSLNRLPTAGRPGDAARRSPSARTSIDFDHELAGRRDARGRRHARPEPRAREPGAAPPRRGDPRRRRSRRPARRDAGAPPGRRHRGRPSSRTTSSTRSTCRSSSRSGADRTEPRAARPRDDDRGDARRGGSPRRRSAPFDHTFAMRRATGDRWLNVAVLPGTAP